MTAEEKAFCESWVRAHAHKWQVLNRAQWNYKFRGKVMVRYVDEVQMRENEVRPLLEYLSSDDCIATLSLYDQSLGGEWKPTKAWYEISNKSVGSVRAVRLYHGIRTDVEDGEDGPYVVEDGCAYKVSLTYYWSVPDVIEVPKSESGISYRINGISRNDETGMYTYVLEKRERVQQDIAEYLMSETVYSKASEEVHLGVSQGSVSSTGQQVSVGGGRLVERKLSKNSDCTSDIHNRITEEIPVSGATVRLEKTLEGIIRTTKNRNQASPAPLTPDKPGSSVTNEKTPGGLYDQTIVEADETPLGVKGEGCSKTIFEHSHSTTENVPDRPTIDAPTASGGVIEKQSASMTRYGTWDVHKTVEEEKPVARSTRTVRMTLSGEYVREESRNQPEPLPESGLKIGESVTNSKTQGGLYNTSHEIPSVKGSGVISERCHQDNFTHHHTQVENKGADADDVAEHSFEDGVIVDKAVSVQTNGTKDVTTSTTTPKPWIQRYDWVSGDSRHFVVKYGNQPDEFANVVVPTDVDSVSKNDHINAFNLHDGQISWSYGPWRSTIGDLKFIKHGKRQNFYVTWMKPHDRRRYHRVITVQIVHIRGDAYTDYISAEIEADRNRGSDGILATKHISTYKDKDGNLLAEWIELRGFTSEEKLCTRLCKHGNIDNDDANEKIQSLVDSFGGSSNGGYGGGSSDSSQVAQAIMALANVMMAQNSYNTGIRYDQHGNAQMGDRTWMANGNGGIREWK